MRDAHYNPWLHRVALLTTLATFPLIFMGGLVTSKGAGMSVPDWPNSYGYNMFAFPFSLWLGTDKGGIFYEHAHRLMGTVVGLLAIVGAVVAWRAERRPAVRWLATGVLAAVIVQGLLGGMRVVLVNLDLAIVHACFAQAFFCLSALLVTVTSRWWQDRRPPLIEMRRGQVLVRACAIATAVIYLQLIVGAVMRHYGAGLAIPDVPLAYGQLLPPTDAAGLDAVNNLRAYHLNLDRVTLLQIWSHFAHRLGAVAVSVAVLTACGIVLARHRFERALLRPALFLIVLLATQVTLGIYTVIQRKPADVASAHVAVGALVLLTSFVLTVRAVRLYRPSRAMDGAGVRSRRRPERMAEMATA